MTDTEYTPNPLQQAYNAAIVGAGRQSANETCRTVGGVTDNGLHPWRRVESSKQAACLKALEALAGTTSKPKPHPAAVRSFESVRRESFARITTAEREAAPPPPKRLDAESIYSKWNAAKRTDDEE